MVLLIGGGDVRMALVDRLLSQGDEIRVIEEDRDQADDLSRRGAHVAAGAPDDPDLIERAAQGVRSVIVLDDSRYDLRAIVEAACDGAAAAGRDIRIIVSGANVPEATVQSVRGSGLEFVVIHGPARRALLSRRTSVDIVVEAIDAADDMSGHPQLELNLGRREARASLGLKA